MGCVRLCSSSCGFFSSLYAVVPSTDYCILCALRGWVWRRRDVFLCVASLLRLRCVPSGRCVGRFTLATSTSDLGWGGGGGGDVVAVPLCVRSRARERRLLARSLGTDRFVAPHKPPYLVGRVDCVGVVSRLPWHHRRTSVVRVLHDIEAEGAGVRFLTPAFPSLRGVPCCHRSTTRTAKAYLCQAVPFVSPA
ncbi:unnamed protein product [Schistocephalus solidus]|uniref:Secreted protein n=1 Tax=Schistocephalus solidus TaxID=70667 RepID=A0A183SJM9_SCHSO|nr:unnamed protein product [Schistocephalus solidus]